MTIAGKKASVFSFNGTNNTSLQLQVPVDAPVGPTTVTVGSNGWFEYSVQLTSQDHGCVSAQAIDWRGLTSDIATYNV